MLTELQARERLTRGSLVQLRPQVGVLVALHWHQWKLGAEGAAPARAARLDEIGAALARGAAQALG